VAVLAVAAFLLWGPIGLGNGPLHAGRPGAEGWADSADAPVAVPLPIYYSGHDPAVIDGFAVFGGAGYPGPHLIAVEALAIQATCSGLGPAAPAAKGFVEPGCGGRVLGPLIGSSFAAHHALSPSVEAVAEFAAPRLGTCWTVTKIVVHYHVGIRHFTATGAVGDAVCATNNMGLVQRAMDAADAS
jgi:hypothetical protein